MSLDTKAKLHAAIDSKQTSTFQDAIDTAKSTAPDTTDEIAKQVAMDKGGQTGFQTWLANLTPTQTAALTAAGVAVTICLIIVLIYFLYDPTLPPSPSPGTSLGTPSPGTSLGTSLGTPSPGTSLGTPSPGTSPSCVGTNIGSYIVSTPICINMPHINRYNQDMSSDGQTIIFINHNQHTIDIYNNCSVKTGDITIPYTSQVWLAIAISGDGQTILYGNSSLEEVYVFDINGTQISKLTPDPPYTISTGTIKPTDFGLSLAISNDGQTIVVGAPSQQNLGRVYIYHRIGNIITKGPTITPPTVSATGTNQAFGYHVSISGNGQILVISNLLGTNAVGSVGEHAFVFDITGNQIGPMLESSIPVPDNSFSDKSSISYNGEIIAITSWKEHNQNGRVYIYYRNASTITPIVELGPPVSTSRSCFGLSVSISGNGNTLSIGALCENNDMGLVYMYDITGSGTGIVINPGPILNPYNTNNYDFGLTISTSFDGQTMLIGDTECLYIYKK